MTEKLEKNRPVRHMDFVDQEALNSNEVLLMEVITPSVLRTTKL